MVRRCDYIVNAVTPIAAPIIPSAIPMNQNNRHLDKIATEQITIPICNPSAA